MGESDSCVKCSPRRIPKILSGVKFWPLWWLIHVWKWRVLLPKPSFHTRLFFPLSLSKVQEPEIDDSAPGPAEVNSWEVNTERVTSSVGKLYKTESQNHMSPR